MSEGPASEGSGGRRCPRCGEGWTVRDGHARGQPRWLCRGCGRSFGARTGTALAGLQTEVAEVVRTLLIVMRRGSLRAAEEITGHQHETISKWVHRAAAHAEALSAVLVHDLQLSEVEVDEFWSFVQRKKGASDQKPRRTAGRPTNRWTERRRTASAGAA